MIKEKNEKIEKNEKFEKKELSKITQGLKFMEKKKELKKLEVLKKEKNQDNWENPKFREKQIEKNVVYENISPYSLLEGKKQFGNIKKKKEKITFPVNLENTNNKYKRKFDSNENSKKYKKKKLE
jgi:hypothetical protein